MTVSSGKQDDLLREAALALFKLIEGQTFSDFATAAVALRREYASTGSPANLFGEFLAYGGSQGWLTPSDGQVKVTLPLD